jgi:dTDP-4-dehydrorhamnose reductase
MRILLFGKNGQLGWELHRSLLPLGEIVAIDQEHINLVDTERLPDFIREINPQVIINPAAYTQVDKAESEPELARAVNAIAPGVMAEEAKRLGALFIHYSTDYVFDGKKGEPYTEEDPPYPINVYGETKLEGERAVGTVGGNYLILRTSWVYSMRCHSFPNKVLHWARDQKELRIVDDQIGSPTWARMLAQVTAILLAQGREDPLGWLSERSGLFHLAGLGQVSRFEWARAILEMDPNRNEQSYKELIPLRSEEFHSPAKRPLYSALDIEKFGRIFGVKVQGWKKSLILAMEVSA